MARGDRAARAAGRPQRLGPRPGHRDRGAAARRRGPAITGTPPHARHEGLTNRRTWLAVARAPRRRGSRRAVAGTIPRTGPDRRRSGWWCSCWWVSWCSWASRRSSCAGTGSASSTCSARECSTASWRCSCAGGHGSGDGGSRPANWLSVLMVVVAAALGAGWCSARTRAVRTWSSRAHRRTDGGRGAGLAVLGEAGPTFTGVLGRAWAWQVDRYSRRGPALPVPPGGRHAPSRCSQRHRGEGERHQSRAASAKRRTGHADQ
ncbi:hypothetical protein QJS66_06885 [Kocuria rhizophila]|nr:hypothetical protein QJS66_06885 [Kocuria rhizophila]